MNGSLGRMTAQGEERVTFTADASHGDRFIPQVAGSTTGGSSSASNYRPFDGDDMGRVMDYEGLSDSSASPPDGPLRYCQQTDLSFPTFHFCLRGGFLFYFNVNDIDDEAGPYTTYHNPPVGAIPLNETVVEYPPGGRRVFREHAQTEARTGYEMAILHVPPRDARDNNNAVPIRPPVFLVAEKLGNREKWKNAIQARASVANKPTFLRAGYTKTAAARKSTLESPDVDGEEEDDSNNNNEGSNNNNFKTDTSATTAAIAAAAQKASALEPAAAASTKAAAATAMSARESSIRPQEESSRRNGSSSATATATTTSRKKSSTLKQRAPGGKSIEQQVLDVSNDEELAAAVVEFGVANYNENEWMSRFFQSHNDFDASTKCRQMEHWQMDMKKSLKGAVLEQYEYFVEASGEMTTMGREVTALKNYIETQVETIKEMKEIDFAAGAAATTLAAKGLADDGRDELMGRDNDGAEHAEMTLTESSPKTRNSRGRKGGDAGTSGTYSETSGSDFRSNHAASATPIFDNHDDDEFAPPIDIPDWLEDAQEEIAAFIRECRYNDAIEIQIKARNEIQDLFDKHERPTAYRLQKAQISQLRTMLQTLDNLGKRISTRLEETLRRKNEALKQSSKRERSDPNAANITLISPCALNDDALYLQLLVKLGRTQQAAEAYSARRSLLLLETLHERPISGSGSVDLVIYAAQLSQSFFSCLADSVEGFLDLFMASDNPSGVGGGGGQHHHHDQNGGGSSNNHSNIHKNEEMSIGDSSSIHSHHASKCAPAGSAMSSVVLWCDAELFKFAAAFGGTRILANLALSPPTRANQRGNGPLSRMQQQQAEPSQPRVVGQDDVGKERRNAIEVAAQCLDQAFQYASSNLDSVGLPLTPRLAEYLRARLKGCEAEVSGLLDQRWQILTADWRMDNGAVVGAVANNMLSNGTAF